MQVTRLGGLLPTLPALAGLFPGGGLRHGCVYTVPNSTSLLMALLSVPSRDGAWCGVVGLPDFGIEAAAGLGIALDRLVQVPRPGDRWLAVTAALVDALPVVAVRPPAPACFADAARLSARLRQRGGVLLVAGPWSQCEAELTLEARHWEGLGPGHGSLSGMRVTVIAASGHGGMTRRASAVFAGGEPHPSTDAAARPHRPAGRWGAAWNEAGVLQEGTG